MVSKYSKQVYDLLQFEKIKSTNEILQTLEKNNSKTINWHLIYKVLKDLEARGEAERLETKWGLFWRRKA